MLNTDWQFSISRSFFSSEWSIYSGGNAFPVKMFHLFYHSDRSPSICCTILCDHSCCYGLHDIIRKRKKSLCSLNILSLFEFLRWLECFAVAVNVTLHYIFRNGRLGICCHGYFWKASYHCFCRSNHGHETIVRTIADGHNKYYYSLAVVIREYSIF